MTTNVFAWQCQQDGRTLTEYLVSNDSKTIFICKLEKLIPKEIENNTANSNNKMVIIGGDRPQQIKYSAKIIQTYFGHFDTTHIILTSEFSYPIGDTFLIYTRGSGRNLFFGGYCDERTKNIKNTSAFEIKTLSEISRIIIKKETKSYLLKDEKNKIIAKGKFKKGKPVKTWFHNYPSGITKTKNELKIQKTTSFFQNGFIQSTNQIFKDSVVSLMYSNKINGQIEYWITWYDNYQTDYSREYKNGKLKNSHYATSMIGYVKEWIDYYENGNVYIKGQYLKGKKNGEWITYNEDGTIGKVEKFD